MTGIDWTEFLRDYNVALIEDEALGEQVAEAALGADWLGAPGLDARELAALEKRLDRPLPKSYRDFLAASGDGRPVADADYFVYGDEQDAGSIRPEYVDGALQIGDSDDNGIYLLNPKIVAPDGEWEAWHLAPFYPGASRFRSFAEMIRQERSELRRGDDDE
jgi:hypothetical protein